MFDYSIALVRATLPNNRPGWRGIVSRKGKRVYETVAQLRSEDAKILAIVWLSATVRMAPVAGAGPSVGPAFEIQRAS